MASLVTLASNIFLSESALLSDNFSAASFFVFGLSVLLYARTNKPKHHLLYRALLAILCVMGLGFLFIFPPTTVLFPIITVPFLTFIVLHFYILRHLSFLQSALDSERSAKLPPSYS
jgi:fatty acid desaturase